MKIRLLTSLNICLIALLFAGCAEMDSGSNAPPVMSAIGDLQVLKEASEKEAELARAKAAAEAAKNAPRREARREPVLQKGKFVVEFDTTVGKFQIEVDRSWSPIGAHRFYKLVKDNFYDDAGFFRVVPGFMVQWGIAADPAKHAQWDLNINDDPMVDGISNKRGYVSFAKTGAPNSRSTQLFINYADNSRLDPQGFSPFGKVILGMDVVDRISSAHGEEPDQSAIEQQGNGYLKKYFPKLDYIKSIQILSDDQPDQIPGMPLMPPGD